MELEKFHREEYKKMTDIFNSVAGDIITYIILGLVGFALINPIRSKLNKKKEKKEEGNKLSEKTWELADTIPFLATDIRRYIYLKKELSRFEKNKMNDMIPKISDTIKLIESRSIDTINKICEFNTTEFSSNFSNQLSTIIKIQDMCRNIERIITLHNNDLKAKLELLDNQQENLEKMRLTLIEQTRTIESLS
ncbi:hypothetical protein [Bacillus inaquosorum]|uniref:hypothetical protein n=1 Tax=Bacillus inaquosorum TaxID=483913 RepID=UPI002E0C02A9|nr:hypothetical protein [Bacillus inaquosorum]MED1194976.1 hypothetical protein [Bacillus inaquosorum]MED1224474.1 hypothetical protein [Bacillus inaquosorum]